MARLGDILVEQGAIRRDVLEEFLPRLQGRIGTALRAQTLIRGRALAQALAAQHRLRYLTLKDAQMESGLFVPRQTGHYLRHQYLPYRMEGEALCCITPDPSPELAQSLSVYYARPVTLCVISARDFTRAFSLNAATTLTRRATLHLRKRYQSLVADRVMLAKQRYVALGIITAIIGSLLLAPTLTWLALIVAANLFYAITLAFKLQLYVSGNAERNAQKHLGEALDEAAQTTDSWPIYTILVPLYREEFPVLSRLISHLHALDYPKDKLDIKLICEADDAGTLAALKQCKPPETMDILTVAPSYPRTKPKACNVALQQIRGEYLVIYDAEDAPEPNQLKRAATYFKQLPMNIACLQAPLNYYNREENLLTRLFSMEYSSLFNLQLPALQRLQLPIPLSGTSNHLRVGALEQVGGWDAFNVTEDADLGMRLAWFGYATRLLPSLTLEESPIKLGSWMRQRSRWIKGFLQTWLVYMRHARQTRARFGSQGYWGFQLFIGAPALTFLIAPFFWLALPLHYLLPEQAQLPNWLLAICAITFVSGIAVQLLYAMRVVNIEGWKQMRLAIAAYPFYWLLHSIASFRALYQLIRTPHHWEKTTHGVSRVFE